MLALQSLSKGPAPTPSVYLLDFIKSAAEHYNQDPATVSGLEASSRPSKSAPENQVPTASSSSGSNASNDDLTIDSTPSSAKDSVSSTTTGSTLLSPEKADFEEPAYPSNRSESLMKTLRHSDDEKEILAYIALREKPLIILETSRISYQLHLDTDIYSHLQARTAFDTFLYTLTCEGDIGDLLQQHPDQHFFLLGRVRARYKGRDSSEPSTYDLQYLIGLNFPERPRSLWLIYDYLNTSEDKWGESTPSLSPQEEEDRKELDSILGYTFDLAQICDNIDEWDPNQGLSEEKVKALLEMWDCYPLDETFSIKPWKLLSDVPSEPDPCSGRKESLDLELSSEQKSTPEAGVSVE